MNNNNNNVKQQAIGEIKTIVNTVATQRLRSVGFIVFITQAAPTQRRSILWGTHIKTPAYMYRKKGNNTVTIR